MEPSSVIAAFSEEHAERLTGVSKSQLRYWDRTRFFTPSLADDRRRPNSRVYSFRDLACLKILNALRNEVRVSLPHLRDVKEKLAHLGEDLWAKTTLYVLNRKVILVNPETDDRIEVVSGQSVLQIPLRLVTADMEKAVRALRMREESTIGVVQRTRGVAAGQAVIAGTRIPVSTIKAFEAAGYSVTQIREQYPVLTEGDIRAALEHNRAA